MDAIKFKVDKNHLKNVKNLFSQFVGLANHITELHDSITSSSGPSKFLEPQATSEKSKLDLDIQKGFEFGTVGSQLCTLDSGIHKDLGSGTVSNNFGTLDSGIRKNLEFGTVSSQTCTSDSGVHKDLGSGTVSNNFGTLGSGIRKNLEFGTVSSQTCTSDSGVHKDLGSGTVNNNFGTLDSGAWKDFEAGTVSSNICTTLPILIVVSSCDDQNNTNFTGKILDLDDGLLSIGTGSTILELDDGSYLVETQVMTQGTSQVEVPNNSAFDGHLEQIPSEEKSNTNSTNFYYLFDGTDPCTLLDHSFDSIIGNEIGGPNMMEVDHNHTDTGGESSDHVCIMCTVNEIATPGINDVIKSGVESSGHATLTVGTTDQSDTINADSDVETQPKLINANGEPFQINLLSRRHGCDNQKMYVPTSDKGQAKQLCCVFCKERFSKFARHLTMMHEDKEEVQQILAHPVGSRARWKCIDKVKKMGQFEWNRNPKINKNELSTIRRPNKRLKKNPTDFDTCPNCLGSYGALRQHWNRCTGNPLPGERIVKVLSRMIEKRIHVDACKELESIIAKMHQDEEVLCIRFDWIVITFANDLCVNLKEVYHHQLVRDKLRNCGKLLLASRLICAELVDFASLFTVKNVNTVVEAIRTVARFDPELKTFGSPGTASTLVTLMNTIGNLLKTEYMKLEDEDKEKAVTRFLAVFERDSKIKINKTVAVDIINARRWKPKNMPITDDVTKLADYLDREREECYNKLMQQYSEDTWTKLAGFIMISILIFNRKRVGDVQNILVIEFNRREFVAESSDSLPEETKKMIKSRIPIRGKLYRTVPLLLKHHVDDCLELLLGYRKEAGVPDNNKFLFGMPSKCGKIKAFNACVLLKTYSKLCGAQNPSSLRGTNLRKHFASVVGEIPLNDNDVTNVANFMGHSEKIHRDVYRHNSLQREVIQMSNLLQVAQGKSDSTVGQVGTSKKKRKEKQSITANDTVGSSNVKTKTQRRKAVTITKPQKRKQIDTRSNYRTKIAK